MAHDVFRRGGVPALASLPLNDGTSCLCSLVVRVNEACRQATITLHFNLSIHGSDTEQRISLVYDADNLVPGEIKLGPAKENPLQLAEITRRNDFKSLRVLHVALKQPCTVLCPRSSGNIVPKDSSDARFQRLVDLAKATRLSIAFDYAWLHPDKSAQFLSLTNSSALSGLPRNSAATYLKEADWTVFSPAGSGPAEAPPAYEPATLKRPLQSRTSSTSPPQTPPAKRPLLEPTIEIPPLSPTEKATTITASPSPRLPPSSPPTAPFDIQDALETAVAKLLPGVVQAALPDVTRVFAVPANSSQTTAAPNSMSLFHNIILNHLTDHAQELAQQVTVDTLEHATELRDTADTELQERLDDQRLEFDVLKEDCLLDIRCLHDARLEELCEQTTQLIESVEQESADAYTATQQKIDELVQSVKQESDDAYTATRQKLDEFVGEQRMKLVKELLRLDAELRRRRGDSPRSLVQRARSVPLDAGW